MVVAVAGGGSSFSSCSWLQQLVAVSVAVAVVVTGGGSCSWRQQLVAVSVAGGCSVLYLLRSGAERGAACWGVAIPGRASGGASVCAAVLLTVQFVVMVSSRIVILQFNPLVVVLDIVGLAIPDATG